MTFVSGLDLAWMLIRRYMEIVKEQFDDKLLAMAVFGSLARGETKFPRSDIDVLIVLKGVEKLSFGKRIKLMRIAEEILRLKNTRGSKTSLATEHPRARANA